jgi:hypothetical protein
MLLLILKALTAISIVAALLILLIIGSVATYIGVRSIYRHLFK